jgi:hypothetical protein
MGNATCASASRGATCTGPAVTRQMLVDGSDTSYRREGVEVIGLQAVRK